MTERRNVQTRGPGLWTQADRERDRFVAELRDARRDEHAVTIQAGCVTAKPAASMTDARESSHRLLSASQLRLSDDNAVRLMNAWRRLTAFIALADGSSVPPDIALLIRDFVDAAILDLNRLADQMPPEQLAETNRGPSAWYPNLQEERWRPR